MICQKCGRVVRPGNTIKRDAGFTERRYYCSCGFVNRTKEEVVLTWKKTEYKPREKKKIVADVKETVMNEEQKTKKKRGRPRKIK